jgi:hypothetical protein
VTQQSLVPPPLAAKKRRGRPELPQDHRRLEKVVVRLTTSEARFLADTAWKMGVSSARLMRAALRAHMAGSLPRTKD